jgi:hypothetical protein
VFEAILTKKGFAGDLTTFSGFKSNPLSQEATMLSFIRKFSNWRIQGKILMQATSLNPKRERESHFNSRAHPQYKN